jgi:hypothetical protein
VKTEIPCCICWQWHLYYNCVCSDVWGELSPHFHNYFSLREKHYELLIWSMYQIISSEASFTHLKGSCFFNQCINTKRRPEFLSHAVIHDRKFTIWWYLFYNSVMYYSYAQTEKYVSENTSLSQLHSPSSEFCQCRNCQGAQIHGNYNHPESQPLNQMNYHNLLHKAAQ